MALGSARIFGIRLPHNFESPYKANNIADFWRRWHISLGQFLRDYLYIPMGGSRLSPFRTFLNLFVTMLLGGLWHGASWTYVIWGAMHGSALAACHAWRRYSISLGWTMPNWLSWNLTMLFVIVGWVIFRASSWSVATSMLASMFCQTTFELPRELEFFGAWTGLTVSLTRNLGNLPDSRVMVTGVLLTLVCKYAPNSRQWIEELGFGAKDNLTLIRSLILALILLFSMVRMLSHNDVFIYYVF
jgi:hypothetical protein